MELIHAALARGQTALDEYQSKQLLASFGIPVTREILARDVEAATRKAEQLGFPVALKASGAKLLHKTEVAGISLDLGTTHDVAREAERLLGIPGCEALLVQEMVKGARELVCGLIRDPHFGPCVMFGIGGILTEIIKDTVFRLAPLSTLEARDMLLEIRSRQVLAPFRGEAAVDQTVLAQILTAIGEIGMKHEEVTEVDINPLKIRTDGTPVALDALVVLKPPDKSE